MKKIFFAIILIFGASYCTVAQAYEEKILSGELKELIQFYPDSTRIVIVCLKPDERIKQLQLKSEAKSPFADLTYDERTAMALKTKSLQDGYQKLLQLGESFYATFGEETPNGPKIDSTHYYLFMNSFLFKAKARNIELMKQLDEVELIIDGDLRIEFRTDKLAAQSEEKSSSDLKNSFVLINQHYNYKATIEEALHFLDGKNWIIRYDKIVLNESIRNYGEIKENDQLTFNLFDNVNLISVVEKTKNINGTFLIRAKILGFDYAYGTITTTNNRTLVDVFIPEMRQWFMIFSNPVTNEHFCVELDYNAREPQENFPLPEFKGKTNSEIDFIEKGILDNGNNEKLGPDDPAEIDVMIVYTQAAANWANNNGGIDNIIEQAIDKAQMVLDNSGTLITLTRIYAGMVEYVESGNSTVDLARLSHPVYKPYGNTWNNFQLAGFMDEVHDLRNMYGADLVSLFTQTGTHGVAGNAWQLDRGNGRENRAFSTTNITHAASSFTFIHELGHNMGCHHHINQQNVVDPNTGDILFPGQPGPGLFSYSAGWRWTNSVNNHFCSVMTYASGQYFQDGITHTRVPHFSNPSVSHQGVPTGYFNDGDNARTLREIKHVIANYRQRQLVWDSLIVENWGYENVEMAQLHNMGFKGEGIRIGILDTGIDHDHPLVNMLVNGNEWHENKLNVVATAYTAPYLSSKDKDGHGHGTAVAGVVWQMAPQAEFVICKISSHAWESITTFLFKSAINKLLSKDVNVISNSNSVVIHDSNCPAALLQVDIIFNNVFNENVIPVNSAGNFGGNPPRIYPSSPGYGENVFSVFSIDRFNRFSSGGSPQFPCITFNKPDFSAPGAGIKTLTRVPLGYYQSISGSSFAAPHTSGIAAILKQVAISELNITNNSDLVMNSIRNSLKPINTFPAAWGDYKPGRINAWAAYQFMLGPQIVTLPPEYVTTNSAKLTGNVLSQGMSGVTNHGFFWGTQPDVVYTGNQVSVGDGAGEFSTVITGLQKNTTYYFRAYASNTQGTNYGTELSFKTPAASNIFVYNAPLGQGYAPLVQLSQNTIDLLYGSQQGSQSVTLSFNITDTDKSINSARLFYKSTGSEYYNHVNLVNNGGDIFEYTLPGVEISSGSLNFFVTASDNDGQTVSLPAFQYLEYPFSLGVLPNQAPIIVHYEINSAMVGEVVQVEATITDPTANISTVKLLYRRHDQAIYEVVEMEYVGNGLYVADLPEITMEHYEQTNLLDGKNGLDYLIKAADEFDAISYFPIDFMVNNTPQNIEIELKQLVSFLLFDPFGQPVETAQIIVSLDNNSSSSSGNSFQIITDEDGSASFYGVSGNYFYSINKEGFFPTTGEVLIESEEVLEVVVLDLISLPVFELFLAAEPAIGGSVSGSGTYEFGSEVIIEATASPGYDFSFWTYEEDTISHSSLFSFEMPNDNIGIIAHFSPTKYALYAEAEPEYGGTVTGSGSYTFGQLAVVSAISSVGFSFSHWSGNTELLNNQNAPGTYFLMPMNEVSLKAHFLLNNYQIILNVNNNESGQVTGNGNYNHGVLVAVEATPNYGYKFVNWTDENGQVVSTQASYSFSVNGDRILTANFERRSFTISAVADPVIGGFISGTGTFLYDTVVTLVGVPANTYHFYRWSEGGTLFSNSPILNVHVDGGRNLVAHFVNQNFILLSQYEVEGGSSAGYAQLTVKSDKSWIATPNDNWLSVDPNHGPAGESPVLITWLHNANNQFREGTISFHNVVANVTLLVSQGISVSLPDINTDGIQVFPNPTTGLLQVKNLPAGSFLYLSDIRGQILIRQENLIEDRNLDLSGFTPGIYHLMIITKTNRVVVKVLKL